MSGRTFERSERVFFMAKRKNRPSKRSNVRTPIMLDPLWGSKRMAVLDGRQVRCLTFDEGSRWIHEFDKLPLLVRRRLADARHNICPTCASIETHNNGTPSLKLYFAVIDAIERTLDRAEQRYNQSVDVDCSLSEGAR
jgi:hypothetical protein